VRGIYQGISGGIDYLQGDISGEEYGNKVIENLFDTTTGKALQKAGEWLKSATPNYRTDETLKAQASGAW
jgi:hypothetical protein